MATPEIHSQQTQESAKAQLGQEKIETRQEEYVVPETQTQLGITAVPTALKPLVDENQNVVAQPVGVQPQVFTVTTSIVDSEADLTQLTQKGNPDESKTWLGWHILRQVKKHVLKGFSVVFAKPENKI